MKHVVTSSVLALFLLTPCAWPQTPATNVTTTNLPPRVNAAIVPAERTGGAARRFEELNTRVQAAQGQVDLVFIGDSITQGWEGNGKQVWAKYYGQRRTLNLGISGDRTEHLLWRFDHGNLDGIKPKAAVVMIGTNNSGKGRNTPAEILAGVTAVVRRLREKLPDTRVLLLGIFPRGADFNDQRGDLLQVNQALRKLANGDTICFLDFGDQLIEADGRISKAIMPDYLHLSPHGYEIWAAAIEPQLSQWLGGQPVK